MHYKRKGVLIRKYKTASKTRNVFSFLYAKPKPEIPKQICLIPLNINHPKKISGKTPPDIFHLTLCVQILFCISDR